MKVLKWLVLGALLCFLTFYWVALRNKKSVVTVPVHLSFSPLAADNFSNNPHFKWLHRHCQPANPFDSANLEDGWLKSLERTASDKFELRLNSPLKWGSGEVLDARSIEGALKAALLEGESLAVATDGAWDLTTQRSDTDVLDLLQGLLISANAQTPIKKAEDMQCFGKFKHIAWRDGQVSLTSNASTSDKVTEEGKGSDKTLPLGSSDPGQKQDGEPSKGTLGSLAINTIVIDFKAQTLKEKTEAFAQKTLDFVGGVSKTQVSPESLKTRIKLKPQGDILLFFAAITGNGQSKYGEFLAKALNRGELEGIRFPGASISPNPHIYPKSFSIQGNKPVSSFLPDFNFASVPDAKAFLSRSKPALKELKVSYKTSEVVTPFLVFLKARLDASYNVSLNELESEKDIADDLKTHDFVIVSLKNSDTYLSDLLKLTKALYPSLHGDLSYFESKINEKDASIDHKTTTLQKLEKLLLEKFLVIPIGDISSGYLLSDSIAGAVLESGFEAPLFFSSFRIP